MTRANGLEHFEHEYKFGTERYAPTKSTVQSISNQPVSFCHQKTHPATISELKQVFKTSLRRCLQNLQYGAADI